MLGCSSIARLQLEHSNWSDQASRPVYLGSGVQQQSYLAVSRTDRV